MDRVNNETILYASEIHKSFSGTEVLHGVNFKLQKGKIHALVGENGAGKSTLSNIIAGVNYANSGDIYLRGEKAKYANVRDATLAGISMIHQEFNLAPHLSIAQNIFLGKEKVKGGIFLDESSIIRKAESITELIGIDVPVTKQVQFLTPYQQQLTEIAKCLSNNSEIMIMDEPTAPLSKTETEKLFQLMRQLSQKGITIMFISHRLDEVFEICDYVSVMRDGMMVVTSKTSETTKNDLIKNMVGRDLSLMYQIKPRSIGEPVLKVVDLNSKKNRLKNISFELRKGEILGFSGLVGAGRTELMKSILGVEEFDSGYIEIKGQKITKPNIKKIISLGIGYVPEDRKRCGILEKKDVLFNIGLSVVERFTRLGFVNPKNEKSNVQDIVKKLDVKCTDLSHKVGELSGGNQQKTVFGRAIITNPDILILDEPTRGVDVGAKAEIYKLLQTFCEKGGSVAIVSSEQLEIIGVCDRAIVMCEGRITGEFDRKEFSEEKLLKYAFKKSDNVNEKAADVGGNE